MYLAKYLNLCNIWPNLQKSLYVCIRILIFSIVNSVCVNPRLWNFEATLSLIVCINPREDYSLMVYSQKKLCLFKFAKSDIWPNINTFLAYITISFVMKMNVDFDVNVSLPQFCTAESPDIFSNYIHWTILMYLAISQSW